MTTVELKAYQISRLFGDCISRIKPRVEAIEHNTNIIDARKCVEYLNRFNTFIEFKELDDEAAKALFMGDINNTDSIDYTSTKMFKICAQSYEHCSLELNGDNCSLTLELSTNHSVDDYLEYIYRFLNSALRFHICFVNDYFDGLILDILTKIYYEHKTGRTDNISKYPQLMNIALNKTILCDSSLRYIPIYTNISISLDLVRSARGIETTRLDELDRFVSDITSTIFDIINDISCSEDHIRKYLYTIITSSRFHNNYITSLYNSTISKPISNIPKDETFTSMEIQEFRTQKNIISKIILKGLSFNGHYVFICPGSVINLLSSENLKETILDNLAQLLVEDLEQVAAEMINNIKDISDDNIGDSRISFYLNQYINEAAMLISIISCFNSDRVEQSISAASEIYDSDKVNSIVSNSIKSRLLELEMEQQSTESYYSLSAAIIVKIKNNIKLNSDEVQDIKEWCRRVFEICKDVSTKISEGNVLIHQIVRQMKGDNFFSDNAYMDIMPSAIDTCVINNDIADHLYSKDKKHYIITFMGVNQPHSTDLVLDDDLLEACDIKSITKVVTNRLMSHIKCELKMEENNVIESNERLSQAKKYVSDLYESTTIKEDETPNGEAIQ